MMANWTRLSGLESGFAPASMRTKTLLSVGKRQATAGRSIPLRVRSLSTDAAPAAPGGPAETTAGADPLLTRSTAPQIEASFLVRTAFAADSFIVTTSEA